MKEPHILWHFLSGMCSTEKEGRKPSTNNGRITGQSDNDGVIETQCVSCIPCKLTILLEVSQASSTLFDSTCR